jgi:hypothetical protein
MPLVKQKSEIKKKLIMKNESSGRRNNANVAKVANTRRATQIEIASQSSLSIGDSAVSPTLTGQT